MRILERLEQKNRALVQCPQCEITKEMDYYKQIKKQAEDNVCAKCTLINRNKSGLMQANSNTRIDTYVKDHNNKDNGIYLVRFTEARSFCEVQCKHCKAINTIQYRNKIFENYGCGICTNKLAKTPKKERSGYYTQQLAYIYGNMFQRTTNPSSEASERAYTGITICQEWLDDRELFYKWSHENGYTEGTKLSIDRIDGTKGYSPSNCRWTTKLVQARNTKKLGINNTSGLRGVSATGNKWRARIKVDNKEIHLGSFSSKEVAAYVYDNYILLHKLEHTRNFN